MKACNCKDPKTTCRKQVICTRAALSQKQQKENSNNPSFVGELIDGQVVQSPENFGDKNDLICTSTPRTEQKIVENHQESSEFEEKIAVENYLNENFDTIKNMTSTPRQEPLITKANANQTAYVTEFVRPAELVIVSAQMQNDQRHISSTRSNPTLVKGFYKEPSAEEEEIKIHKSTTEIILTPPASPKTTTSKSKIRNRQNSLTDKSCFDLDATLRMDDVIDQDEERELQSLPVLPPRKHGSGCAIEVSILEKHVHGCHNKKINTGGRNTLDDKVGSYDVVGRLVYETCATGEGDIRGSVKGFRLNDPEAFGKPLAENRSKVDVKPILPPAPCVDTNITQEKPATCSHTKRDDPECICVHRILSLKKVMNDAREEILSVFRRNMEGVMQVAAVLTPPTSQVKPKPKQPIVMNVKTEVAFKTSDLYIPTTKRRDSQPRITCIDLDQHNVQEHAHKKRISKFLRKFKKHSKSIRSGEQSLEETEQECAVSSTTS